MDSVITEGSNLNNASDHHHKVEPIPRITQIRLLMHNKALSYNFHEEFKDENIAENYFSSFKLLIVIGLVFFIFIVFDRENNRIEEDCQ